MSQSDFYSGFVPPEDWLPGSPKRDVPVPQGSPAWPFGWNQERVDRANAWENIKLFLILGFVFVLVIACPSLLWMAG